MKKDETIMWYGKAVKRQDVTLQEMAKLISQSNSVTESDVYGVLKVLYLIVKGKGKNVDDDEEEGKKQLSMDFISFCQNTIRWVLYTSSMNMYFCSLIDDSIS